MKSGDDPVGVGGLGRPDGGAELLNGESGLRRNKEISSGTVHLLRDYRYQRHSVLILLADTLTKGERKLVEAGKGEKVKDVRHDFQIAMRDDLIRLVESQVERKVIAFMSDNHLDPDMAAEVSCSLLRKLRSSQVLRPTGAGIMSAHTTRCEGGAQWPRTTAQA